MGLIRLGSPHSVLLGGGCPAEGSCPDLDPRGLDVFCCPFVDIFLLLLLLLLLHLLHGRRRRSRPHRLLHGLCWWGFTGDIGGGVPTGFQVEGGEELFAHAHGLGGSCFFVR
ncbi:unnamed protein product, partial [Musa acuminata var. zebrina]